MPLIQFAVGLYSTLYISLVSRYFACREVNWPPAEQCLIFIHFFHENITVLCATVISSLYLFFCVRNSGTWFQLRFFCTVAWDFNFCLSVNQTGAWEFNACFSVIGTEDTPLQLLFPPWYCYITVATVNITKWLYYILLFITKPIIFQKWKKKNIRLFYFNLSRETKSLHNTFVELYKNFYVLQPLQNPPLFSSTESQFRFFCLPLTLQPKILNLLPPPIFFYLCTVKILKVSSIFNIIYDRSFGYWTKFYGLTYANLQNSIFWTTCRILNEKELYLIEETM
jgi:hypothetical protein